MTLNMDLVGTKSPTIVRTWDSDDALLYALGVGAGQPDPNGFELEFTTENSMGLPQRVLPMFSTIIGGSVFSLQELGIDYTKVVHGEQTIELHDELPTQGSVAVTTSIEGIYDKGSGSLVVLETHAANSVTGSPAFSTRMGLFIRGAGGFGGPRAPIPNADSELVSQPVPSRAPDTVVDYPIRADQALLYRLNGDHNPLHSDPSFAKTAGFDRPILHGLCSYGFTGRALLHKVCGSDPSRFGSMQARFVRPTYPGDTLTILIWDLSKLYPGVYRFRTENQHGEEIIGGGLFRLS